MSKGRSRQWAQALPPAQAAADPKADRQRSGELRSGRAAVGVGGVCVKRHQASPVVGFGNGEGGGERGGPDRFHFPNAFSTALHCLRCNSSATPVVLPYHGTLTKAKYSLWKNCDVQVHVRVSTRACAQKWRMGEAGGKGHMQPTMGTLWGMCAHTHENHCFCFKIPWTVVFCGWTVISSPWTVPWTVVFSHVDRGGL